MKKKTAFHKIFGALAATVLAVLAVSVSSGSQSPQGKADVPTTHVPSLPGDSQWG
ncbi:hypothetical protein AB0H73_27220 [Streptomyces olivoreticuli]|uniref:hypothetical protein n=1 Tax=Streptomyces olivoreticuli TaxID=68246 RepID=UPI0013C351B3|nr:hypothetical protein [Streptomyces olivoreticuli]